MRSRDEIRHLATVVISLDFELRWGNHDRLGLDPDADVAYIEKTREVIPEMLRLLVERDLHATWAVVGGLACSDWGEYFRRAPPPPRYHDPRLAVKPQYAEIDPDGRCYFAPDLIQEIVATPYQELGTHTFSHIYLREPGVFGDDFSADLAAVSTLYEERFGQLPVSLVFPRNQDAFLDLVQSSSIRIWRGNENAWYFERREKGKNDPVSRLLRLVDSINPRSRRALPLQGNMTRASVFLRLNLPAPMWHLHLERIVHELRYLRPGQIFHLWFHPENVAHDPKLGLERLRKVFDTISRYVTQGGLASRSMGELQPS